MIDRLDSLARAIATLRSSVAQGAPNRATAAPAQGTAPGASSRAGGHSHVASLPARLASLAADDPQRTRRALRLFIEAVLLDQLGEGLLLSADWDPLVEKTLAALEGDEGLRALLDQSAHELLGRGQE